MNTTSETPPGGSSAAPNDGISSRLSPHSFDETLRRLESAIHAKGLTLFARVDHSGEARRVGLTMPPTVLLIFGSPVAGTPLMVASPLLALDLPLKALVRQDGDGRVWVSFNTPDYLASRHHIPPALIGNIAGASPLVDAALSA
ncbi:MAG: DUF302 domain-containing protein [Ktedonobacterales bacterium]